MPQLFINLIRLFIECFEIRISVYNKIKMETRQEFMEQDEQTHNNKISLTEYSQTHPYQFLKQLNNVYQQCNKTSGKDFSSASMIKLPWKKFKTVSIPKCFEESYNLQRKQTFILKNSEDCDNSVQVEKQKKFWREHEDLMKKYYLSNIANTNSSKHRYEQRRKNLFSAKPHSNSQIKNSMSCISKNQANKTQNNFKLKQHKENNDSRFTTLKTQSDQPHQNGHYLSKQLIPMYRSSTNLLKDNTNTNSLVKKKLERTKYLNQQVSVEEQVLQKLKKISTMPHFNRAKTANLLSKQSKCNRQKQKIQTSYKKLGDRESLRESRVKEGQYLEYNMKEELIERYKNKIKEIDCSISEKNVKKTADILKEMQHLASIDIEDY